MDEAGISVKMVEEKNRELKASDTPAGLSESDETPTLPEPPVFPPESEMASLKGCSMPPSRKKTTRRPPVCAIGSRTWKAPSPGRRGRAVQGCTSSEPLVRADRRSHERLSGEDVGEVGQVAPVREHHPDA